MIERLRGLAAGAPDLSHGLPGGWLTGAEQRMLWALGAAASGPVLEVGAWLGRSTVCIARGVEAGSGVPFTTVELSPTMDDWELVEGIMYFRPGGSDPVGGTPVDEFDATMRSVMERPGGVEGLLRENLRNCGVDHLAEVRIGDVRNLVFPGQFDVVFLDTAHSIEEIRQNAKAVRRLLASSAVLACHDTTPENEAELRRQFPIVASLQVDSLFVAQVGDGPGTATYEESELFVRPGTWDAGMADEIWLDRYYTTGGFEIPDGANVLDIGGGIGAFAIFAATHGAQRVDVYEPHPETFELLVRNIEANGLTGVITAHNAAVATTGGTMALTGFAAMDDGTINTGLPRLSETGDLRVQCVDVHEALAGSWDVVKLDIEGYEYELLDELTAEEWSRIGMVTMEFHHDEEATTEAKGREMADTLERHGFDVALSWAWGQQGRIQARSSR